MAAGSTSQEQESGQLSDKDGALAQPIKRKVRFGLSTKLLVLTAIFVMLAEVLIFLPSVASFRHNWLMERLIAAQIAALATEAAPSNVVPNRLRKQLLDRAQVHSVIVRRNGARRLVLQTPVPGMVEAHFNLEQQSTLSQIKDTLLTFFSSPKRLIHVIGKPALADNAVEIVMTESPLKAAIYEYALSILWFSVLISLITATLVYVSLNALLIRPVARLIRNMIEFRENPEDAARIIKPSKRSDEIGLAQEKLAEMQNELNATLRQKSRLAALGLAVSKINHDLRNMLSSAQLMSDRLATVRDATVQRIAPKLIASLDRAIAFCTETLRYGRAEEAAPVLRRFPLREFVEEVGEALGLPGHGRINWVVEMEGTLEVEADRSQLSRILTNLIRNAIQVLDTPPEILRPEIKVSAVYEDEHIDISVKDNGPGVPARARANLFQAFQGSVRVGGTGLGLAISAELTRAHGGEIRLDDSTPGATFHVRLPAPAKGVVDFRNEEQNFDEGTLAFGRPKH